MADTPEPPGQPVPNEPPAESAGSAGRPEPAPPQPVPPERALVEQTLADLRQLISVLRKQQQLLTLETRRQVEEIDRQIADATNSLQRWEKYLKGVKWPVPVVYSNPRLTGEAASLLHRFYDKRPGAGLTLAELAQATGIAWTAIRNVMESKESGFEKRGERWFKIGEPKQEPPTPPAIEQAS